MRKLVLALFALYSGYSVSAQTIDLSLVEQQLRKHITYLADDELEGRLVGSKGEWKAATYVAKNFKKYGLLPKGTKGYYQQFSLKKNLANPHGSDSDAVSVIIKGHNVIGYIDNKATYTVIIGAHYDHLGYNEFGSSTYRPEQKDEKPKIHNGADDNASGTAALLELARLLKISSFKSANYLFIAFSGEEEGLLGSNYYTKNPTIDTALFSYMINMDMVGRLDTLKQSFAISGTGTSPAWEPVLKQLKTPYQVKFDASGTGASDHTSFYYLNIPVLHFFTGTHYDYHKPSDDAEKINYKGAADIVHYIYNLVGVLDQQATKLKFTPTAQDTSAKVSFKVTLGIMPDYLFDGVGVKVDGATPGKPAANAGIKRGDLILKLGNYDTPDMKSYMKALSLFKKGEHTEVLIKRNDQELTLPIQF